MVAIKGQVLSDFKHNSDHLFVKEDCGLGSNGVSKRGRIEPNESAKIESKQSGTAVALRRD